MSHQFFFSPHILDNLAVPGAGFDVVQDSVEPNLRMYVTSRGVKSFFVRKRVNGRDIRIIIGQYPDMNIDDARTRVSDVLRDMARPKPARRAKATFKKIIDLYVLKKVRRNDDSLVKLKRSIARYLTPLFEKNIRDITPNDIRGVLFDVGGASACNRMLDLIISIFNFAVALGYVSVNPAADISRAQEVRRVRPLTKSGMSRVMTAILAIGDENIRAAFLMLVYGFAPKSKIFSMRWRDLDFNQYTWGDRPLSDAAVVLLESLPQDGRWVFPSRGRHLTDPRAAWRDVARIAKIPNLTMDDVHKFLMKQLVWAGEKEQLRENMNAVIEGLGAGNI